MSIRMIVLTDAYDHGTKVRIAAHAIQSYFRNSNMNHTLINAVWHVAETPDEIDHWFNVCWPDDGWQPQEVDEIEGIDASLNT